MIEKIRDYEKIVSRFHMPGHSGVNIDGDLYAMASKDITELDFSDNLLAPTGIIKELEDKIARAYHSKRAIMLTQGATAGIDTCLLIAREMRGKLYLLGETHKSCYSFASIIGLDLIELKSIEEAIKVVSEGAFVYVTTPNYYGMTIDISRVLDSRDKGGAVIVDEAHGSHFAFSDILPTSLADKADFVVDSLHKTLPVFTGGAVLNINDEEYIDMAIYFRNKIHSTSPSYLIMQSIDYAMDYMMERGDKAYRDIKVKIETFKDGLDSRYAVLDTDDFTRLVIECDGADDVVSYLENRGTYIELNDEKRLVLIVTPFNVDRLAFLKDDLNSYRPNCANIGVENRTFSLSKARHIGGKLRFVSLDEAVGKVNMNEIAIYPPGVPLAHTGEVLTREVIDYIKAERDRIVGLIADTIAVREVCEED